MRLPPSTALAIAAGLALLGACDGPYWEDEAAGCQESPRVLGLEEAGLDGVLPIALLAEAEGSSTVEITWEGSGGGYMIELGNPEQTTGLEMTVSRIASQGNWVERRGMDCTEPDRTEVPVRIALATADGVLVGNIEGIAHGTGPVFVTAEGFDPGDLETFEPSVVEPTGGKVDAMRLHMRVTDTEPVWGSLSAQFFDPEVDEPTVASEVALAEWNAQEQAD